MRALAHALICPTGFPPVMHETILAATRTDETVKGARGSRGALAAVLSENR